MFANDLNVMLYVDDVPAAAAFWESIGFHVFSKEEADGTMIVEIGPSESAQGHVTIYDRNFVLANSPEVNVAAPSIMFTTDDAEGLYRKMMELDVTLGDLVQIGERMIFNFADNDGNYFAVTSK